ncbi:hypothetical protein F4V91_26025 [Neorhizobium galegae]|uniref:Uncharacterized protein n=1 Tax=Neorhizobium galegae TaxID=399 RepID=A0A6A1TH38_NEOGA|nr:hypothetical protein [Neorhizobium galegae]KAB1083095.1 hypothetical protein F4V91_26025 [Neorhizobium galegae]
MASLHLMFLDNAPHPLTQLREELFRSDYIIVGAWQPRRSTGIVWKRPEKRSRSDSSGLRDTFGKFGANFIEGAGRDPYVRNFALKPLQNDIEPAIIRSGKW